MKPLELALKYMDIFFSGSEPEEMRSILHTDLQFHGPLFRFDNANDYINSLLDDPPKECVYRILQTYERDSSACLIYEFSKPGIATLMAQTFEIERERIKKIILIFDRSIFR